MRLVGYSRSTSTAIGAVEYQAKSVKKTESRARLVHYRAKLPRRGIAGLLSSSPRLINLPYSSVTLEGSDHLLCSNLRGNIKNEASCG
jgi:hypothetical protein